jgi:hypothetical protein
MLRHVIACAVAAGAVVACFPQGACTSDPAVVDYCLPGDSSCQGKILDANHWESGPINGTWLNFSRERTINMHFRDAQTGATLSGNYVWADVAINVAPQLSDPPNQYVPSAGNNSEITPFVDGSGLSLRNDTCADYFVYVYATIYPNAPADAGSEASTDGATE